MAADWYVPKGFTKEDVNAARDLLKRTGKLAGREKSQMNGLERGNVLETVSQKKGWDKAVRAARARADALGEPVFLDWNKRDGVWVIWQPDEGGDLDLSDILDEHGRYGLTKVEPRFGGSDLYDNEPDDEEIEEISTCVSNAKSLKAAKKCVASGGALGSHASYRSAIVDGLARSLFVDAWASWQEENGWPDGAPSGGEDLDNLAPPTPKDAEVAAEKVAAAIEKLSGKPLPKLLSDAAVADGKDVFGPSYAEDFGSDLAMMVVGSGVSWFDAHEEFTITIPDVEFNMQDEDDFFFSMDADRLHRSYGT